MAAEARVFTFLMLSGPYAHVVVLHARLRLFAREAKRSTSLLSAGKPSLASFLSSSDASNIWSVCASPVFFLKGKKRPRSEGPGKKSLTLLPYLLLGPGYPGLRPKLADVAAGMRWW